MTEKFTVCIGRQYGSGGREVGQLLAQKLGVTCYDKLLIREAARESHLAESYLEQNEERLTDEILPFSGNPFADMADLSGVFYSRGQDLSGGKAGRGDHPRPGVRSDDRAVRLQHFAGGSQYAVRIPLRKGRQSDCQDRGAESSF